MKAESKRSWIQFCLIVSLSVSLLFELQCEQEVRVVPGGFWTPLGAPFCYWFITFYGTNFKSKPTCVWLCSLKVAFSILQVMWCLWFDDSLQTREKHIVVLGISSWIRTITELLDSVRCNRLWMDQKHNVHEVFYWILFRRALGPVNGINAFILQELLA